MATLDRQIIQTLAAPAEHTMSFMARLVERSGHQVATFGKRQLCEQLAAIVSSRQGW